MQSRELQLDHARGESLNGRTPKRNPGTIHELFEQQAARNPDNIAVIAADQEITYRRLNDQTTQLANYLVSRGAGAETRIGVLLDRSIEMVIAILAILKSGGAIVPMDTSHPASRLEFMAKDADLRLVIGPSRVNAVQFPQGTSVIDLDQAAPAIGRERVEISSASVGPEDPAYIVYTSGSTGDPKGVVIPHRVFARCRMWADEVFRFTAEDRFLLKSLRAPEELFFPFSVGAATIVAPPDGDRDPALLVETVIRNGITVLGLSPGILSLVTAEPRLEQCHSLRLVFSSGEALSGQTAKAFLRRSDAELYNFYGLAEAPFTALWKCNGEQSTTHVPVGRPVDAELIVLGSDLEPKSIGETGELYVRGPGLALGYLNLPGLNASRFIEHPSYGRLYRTGDLGRVTRDGIYQVDGRTDFQIKIRGFRVELEEVEAVLRRHPAVNAACVAGETNRQGQRDLLAYLVLSPDACLSVEELRSFTLQWLPDYAIPGRFLILPHLPLTTTGKVDRRALELQPAVPLPAGTPYVAPQTEQEQRLAQIWQDLLGRDGVGIDHNFFHLGGHSLSATQVIARIRADLGFELPLREIFDAPTIRQLAARLSTAVHTQSPLFRRETREGPIPLSFAQERLWFLDQLEPGSSAYHIPDAYLMNGPLDVSILERSLEAVVQRHELLRTTLQSRDGKPVQVVADTAALKIHQIDRRGISEAEQELEIERQIKENSATVFDLARGPLLQLKVVRLAPERYLLLVNMHHVVSDDWSLGVFYRELSQFYAAFVNGKPAELPALPLQYSDYAICQRKWLESGELSRQLSYWQTQLSGLETLDLPTDFPRPPRQTFVGTRIPFSLSPELTARLKAFNRGENATHFMTLLAAFQVLLSRYARQSDVVVGTPIANRRHVELEALFGFFVNMLVLRGDLTGNPNFRELVRRARRAALDAYQHQDMPFEKLVEALNPDRDLSRPPLFQVMFAIQDVPTHPLAIPGAQVSRRVHGVHATHFDLELYLSTQSAAWTGFVGYNTDLFSAATIERMIGHYQTLLESLLAAPDLPVFTTAMLTRGERGQLAQWSHPTQEFGPPDCIHQLFEAQVAKSPNATAVQFENQTLTYQELEARANQLAAHLQSMGVRRETRVGVCVERSLEMVVALLGILKAGGTYVPIDIHFPPDRIALILKDAEADVLILHDSLRRLCLGFNGAVVSLDQPVPDVARIPNREVSGADAAYIYYTSGSTGRPKGVLLEHRSVVNFLRAFQERPGMTDRDVLLALTTLSFDPAVLEIFLPLSVGARIVIVPEATRMDPEKLVDLLQQSGATIFQATPTMWRLLLRSQWRRPEVRALIGGEILTPDLAREILSRCGELWNLYGPTETTVWSMAARIESPDDITIGSTIPNQRAYIVDPHDQPVPVGVPGELLIGGVGVGRHYVARPELSAERFVPDRFAGKNGARVYRTGDLCRYRADGQIEFLGRVDQQIKIRGFRIEPGEIEAALIEHPAIRQCAVVDRTESSGERRLIGYIVASDSAAVPDAWGLREFLRRKLPDYMLPAAFVTLDKLPLTRSGKIQRSALPAPEPVRRGAINGCDIGRNTVERQVAKIWEDILCVDQIGLTDDFFEIGGHSLMAIRLMTEINAAFVIHLPLATIFRAPTIESLALAIQTSSEIRIKPPGLIIHRGHESDERLFWAPSVGPAERFVECHNLARMLRGHYRFCGFDPAPELTTIDGLAEHSVRLIREEQPQGPYYLAGYCQAGHVAYQIATRLEQEGEKVAVLAIIDCSARDMAPNLRQKAYWLRDGFRGTAPVVLRRIGRFVRRKVIGANGSAPRQSQPENPFFEHGRAVTTHKARPFSGTVTLFRSDEWLARLPHSPSLGWDALAAKLRVCPVRCGHTALLSDPAAVQVVVDSLKESLECQLA